MENSQRPGGTRNLKTAYRTAYLIAGFLKGNLTEEEKEELDTWILSSDENMELFEKMTDEKNIGEAGEWFKKLNVENDLSEVKKKIRARRPVPLWQYAVAAVAVVLIIVGIYIYRNSNTTPDKSPVATQKQDIMPGFDKATLTMENGKVVELANDGSDTAINDHIRILRKGGQLIYSPAVATNEIVYHTLTVPRKGQFKLILPDGSKVWLNSESSIRYPVSFVGNERRVFVTGETFFEVTKDKEKPFRVVSGDVTIEALGTQFNVNAYNNEPFFSATLVEGSIMVTKGSKENILKPGQQAQLTDNDFQIEEPEVAGVVAWKDNKFRFIKTPIDVIMRQVERWYDADVEFQDKVSLHLNATLERNVPVSKLLDIFEQTGQVHFKIEGKKIIVRD